MYLRSLESNILPSHVGLSLFLAILLLLLSISRSSSGDSNLYKI